MPKFVMNGWLNEVSAASLDGKSFVRINDNFRADSRHIEKLKAALADENVPKFTLSYLRDQGFRFDSFGPTIDLIHLADTDEIRFVF